MRLSRILFVVLIFSTSSNVAPACDRDCRLFEALKGKWRAGDFELIDSGHCMAEESLDLHLNFRALTGRRVVGEYIEYSKRDSAYGDCASLGEYRISYKFSIKLNIGDTDSKLFAVLDLLDCRQDGKRKCGFAAKRMIKEIVPGKDGLGLLFDGVAFDRTD